MVDYSPYGPLFKAAGQQYGLDPALLQAMARTEAGIDDRGRPLTSPAGAVGIMQFMPGTARDYNVDPTNPSSSVFGAANYYRNLLQYYGGDIPSALAAYNGSTGDAGQSYARSVLGHYQDIQAEEHAAAQRQTPSAPPVTSGTSISEAEAKLPPERNLSPEANRSPMHFDISTTPGSQSEYAIADEPDIGTTLYGSPAPTPQAPAKGAPAAGPDIGTTLYGPGPPAPPPPPTLTPQGDRAQPAQATGTPPTAPAPAAAPSALATAPGAPTGTMVPGGAADLPSRSPYTPPTFAPTPTTWLGRNIAAPVEAMMHPDQPQPQDNYLLATPALQSVGAGVVQGARNIAQTMSIAADRLDQAYPWLGEIDRTAANAGVPTAFSAPGTTARLAAETAANRQRYQGDFGFGAGQFVGDIAGAEPFVGPFVGPIAGATRATGAAVGVPTIGRYAAPVLAGAFGGGAQNALTSGGYGEDPWQAAKEGALGGAVLGGTVGNVGNYLLNRAGRQAVVDTANDLGIPLSQGDIGGPRSFIKGYEDTTSPLPFSGEAKKVADQQQAITRLLTREMGEPEQDVLRPPDMQRIRGNIGDRINAAAANIDVPYSSQLQTDLGNIENFAMQSGPDSPQARNFRAIRDEVLNMAANNQQTPNTISGPQFQRFLAQHSTLDNALSNSNLDVQQVARRVRDALFDAAVPTTQAPDSLQQLQQARYQWKVEEAVRDSIERTTSGTESMTFPKLAGNIARGNFWPDSPMSRLSQLLYDIPSLASSGTAERSLRQRMVGLLPSTAGEAGTTGLLWALNNPHSFDQMLANIAAPIAGNIVGGRLSRFGPSMGSNALEAARQVFNPLLPRAYGPTVGNYLMGPQPPAQPQPGGQ